MWNLGVNDSFYQIKVIWGKHWQIGHYSPKKDISYQFTRKESAAKSYETMSYKFLI